MSDDDSSDPISQLAKSNINIFAWSDLDKLPKYEYVIKGYFDRGCLSLLYGNSNAGKTFLGIDIACHIVTGEGWHGQKVNKGSVVYISAEGGYGIKRRVDAFREEHDISNLNGLHFILDNVPLGKTDSHHHDLIKCLNHIENLSLVVVDTVARAMGGSDENSASDMGAFIKHCDEIKKATGAHVMLIHHSGKDTSRGARGHSSLKAAVDTEIEIKARGKSGEVTIELKKQRDGPVGQKKKFILSQHHLGTDADGDDIMSCVLKHQNKNISMQKSLPSQAVKAHGLLKKMSQESPNDYIEIDTFKNRFFSEGVSNSDKKSTVDRAYKRNIEKLVIAGLVRLSGNTIVLTDNQDKIGQTIHTNTDRQDTPL